MQILMVEIPISAKIVTSPLKEKFQCKQGIWGDGDNLINYWYITIAFVGWDWLIMW